MLDQHSDASRDYTQLAQQWGVPEDDPMILLLKAFDHRLDPFGQDVHDIRKELIEWIRMTTQLMQLVGEQNAEARTLSNFTREQGSTLQQLSQVLQNFEQTTEQSSSKLWQLSNTCESIKANGNSTLTEVSQVKVALSRIESNLINTTRSLNEQIAVSSAKVMRAKIIPAQAIAVIAMIIGCVGFGGFAWGSNRAHQEDIAEFGTPEAYTFAQELVHRADNSQRYQKCQRDQNPKCTFWIEEPLQVSGN